MEGGSAMQAQSNQTKLVFFQIKEESPDKRKMSRMFRFLMFSARDKCENLRVIEFFSLSRGWRRFDEAGFLYSCFADVRVLAALSCFLVHSRKTS